MKPNEIKQKLAAFEQKPIEGLVLRLFAAWAFAAAFALWRVGGRMTDLAAYKKAGIGVFALSFVFCFVLSSLLSSLLKKKGVRLDPVYLPVTFGVYSAVTLYRTNDFWYALALSVLWAVLVFHYLRRGYVAKKMPEGKRLWGIVCLSGALVFALLVGLTSVLRYRDYGAPNFDFGIFVQMFYSMRRSFAPVTTVERDRLLSHFAVHLSPVYYLLLPVFFVFPFPETLQVSQALILASAAAPLFLLCKEKALSPRHSALLTLAAVFSPMVYCGTFYDFHENCFLLPLLLWTFYFFEKDRFLPTVLFAALTLTVKEDAALYVALFAVFVLLDRKKYVRGAVLLVLAGGWFICALAILKAYGLGVMTSRYENFLTPGDSLFSAVKYVLLDPGYAFTQLFRDADGSPFGKLRFLLQVLAPLAFLPCAVKKPSRLLLLLPMLVMNLLTTYVYQYDIGFQYSFGTAAFLFYLAALNLAELPEEKRELPVWLSTAICAVCAVSLLLPRLGEYRDRLETDRVSVRLMDEALDALPKDVGVTASTFLIPHIADREELYETYYHDTVNGPLTKLVVLDCRYKYMETLEMYLGLGYNEINRVSNGNNLLLIVLEHPGV